MGSNLVIEVSSTTALSGATHNGALLVCSQPVTITTPFVSMNGGFACTIVNLSSGPVTFGSPVISPSGSQTLPPGQSAKVCAFSYSGGDAVFVDMPGGVSLLSAPGQVTGLTVTPNGGGSVVVVGAAADEDVLAETPGEGGPGLARDQQVAAVAGGDAQGRAG